MTTLMRRALDEIAGLSPERQDVTAKRMPGELEDEQRWDASFGASRKMLEALATGDPLPGLLPFILHRG